MRRSRVIALVAATLLAVSTTSATQQDATPQHLIVPLVKDGHVITRVSGDPNTPGAPYVIRIENVDGQIVFPHWHPEDEHIVVVHGTWYLGTGDRFSRDDLQELAVGTYALVPKKMNHFAWSKGATIIQVHGIGPFRINFVDDLKLLRNPGAASFFKFKAGDRVRGPKGTGIIRMGAHSPRERVTQYLIETKPNEGYAALEEELQSAPK
jgi:hypothetical protein